MSHPHRRILLIELIGPIAALGTFAISQVDVPDVAEVVVVVPTSHHAVFGSDLDGRTAADAGLTTQTDDGDGLAEVAAPGGVDEAALELAPAASLQAAADYLPDDSTSPALLALIWFPDDRRLDDFSLRQSSVFIQCSLSQAFGIVLFDPLEVLLFGLVESSGDFLLQDAFSLTGMTGKLVLLMKGGDMRLHLGTDEVRHVRLGVEFVTVSAGDAALLVGTLAFLTIFAALLVDVAAVVIAPHQRVSNAYISMHPWIINPLSDEDQKFSEGWMGFL